MFCIAARAKSPESVRQSLRSFIDLKGKLDLKVKRVLQASDLALVTTALAVPDVLCQECGSPKSFVSFLKEVHPHIF